MELGFKCCSGFRQPRKTLAILRKTARIPFSERFENCPLTDQNPRGCWNVVGSPCSDELLSSQIRPGCVPWDGRVSRTGGRGWSDRGEPNEEEQYQDNGVFNQSREQRRSDESHSHDDNSAHLHLPSLVNRCCLEFSESFQERDASVEFEMMYLREHSGNWGEQFSYLNWQTLLFSHFALENTELQDEA